MDVKTYKPRQKLFTKNTNNSVATNSCIKFHNIGFYNVIDWKSWLTLKFKKSKITHSGLFLLSSLELLLLIKKN